MSCSTEKIYPPLKGDKEGLPLFPQEMLIHPGPQPVRHQELHCSSYSTYIQEIPERDEFIFIHKPEHPHLTLKELPSPPSGKLIPSRAHVDHDIRNILERTSCQHHSGPQIVVLLFPERLIVPGFH